MPAFSTLIENFSNESETVPIGWDEFGTGSPTISHANERLTVTTTNNNFGGDVTEGTYDITGDGVYVEMPVKVAVTGGNRITDWNFEIRDTAQRYRLIINYNGATDVGTISGVRQTLAYANQQTIFSGVAFNYANHRWFRIRESSNNVIFEAAPDASGAPGTWTQLGTATWSTLSKTALFVELDGYTAPGNGTGVATFDNVNGGVHPPFTPAAGGANVFTADLQPSNSTDAHFRLWVTFIRNAFLAGGWVQTTDGGQMDHTTITRPLSTQQQKGYMIFRMDDSLQATKPVFVKIYFGSGAAANSPGIWIIMGTGSNGNGGLTGTMFLQLGADHIYTSSNTTGIATGSHASSSPSHCAVALFVNANANYILTFSIERGRTAQGAEDGDHVFVQYSNGPSSVLNRFTNLIRTGGIGGGQNSLFISAPAILSPGRPVHTQADVGYGNIIPFQASAGGAISAPPCLGYIVMEDDEWTTDAEITVYKYGAPVVYRRLHSVRHSMPGNTPTSNHSVWQRFD